MVSLCYVTYLIVGIVAILINIGMGGAFSALAESLDSILMVSEIFIFPYLLYVIIFSLLKFREKPLFILGLATIVELVLQYAARLSPNNTIIYFSLIIPYLILITVVPLNRLFRVPNDKGQTKSI